jgi:cell division protein FtsW
MTTFLKNVKGDKVIWVVVILLSIVSLLAVYSSSGMLAYRKQGGNTEYYLYKQFFLLLFGFGLMYITHLIRYTYFSRISQIGLVLSIGLLIYTMIHAESVNNARRWDDIFGISYQSSDIVKLFLIMSLARALSKKQELVHNFRSGFLPILLPVILVCALILRDNFSTAAILFVTCLVLMFIGRVRLSYIFSVIGLGLVSVFLIFILAKTFPEVFPRGDTWVKRIETFFNNEKASPDAVYQITQSKIAIASGGLLGKSPGKSTQKNFLPHAESDFIFAIIIEEYGLVGGAFIVLLYCILFFRAVRITMKCQGSFGAFLAIGIGFSLVFQALINMAVAVHLFPVTGQTLPLISMGGTSIWLTSIAIAIILSVSRHIEIETLGGTEVEILSEPQAVPA